MGRVFRDGQRAVECDGGGWVRGDDPHVPCACGQRTDGRDADSEARPAVGRDGAVHVVVRVRRVNDFHDLAGAERQAALSGEYLGASADGHCSYTAAHYTAGALAFELCAFAIQSETGTPGEAAGRYRDRITIRRQVPLGLHVSHTAVAGKRGGAQRPGARKKN